MALIAASSNPSNSNEPDVFFDYVSANFFQVASDGTHWYVTLFLDEGGGTKQAYLNNGGSNYFSDYASAVAFLQSVAQPGAQSVAVTSLPVLTTTSS